MITTVMSAFLLAQATPEPEWDCEDPMAQQEMNACARLDFQQADAELNAAWGEALASARAADAELDRQYDQRPGYEEVLREAQTAWAAFRDAHCTYEGYEGARGGSMEPMIFEGCRAALTRERIRQLRGVADER